MTEPYVPRRSFRLSLFLIALNYYFVLQGRSSTTPHCALFFNRRYKHRGVLLLDPMWTNGGAERVWFMGRVYNYPLEAHLCVCCVVKKYQTLSVITAPVAERTLTLKIETDKLSSVSAAALDWQSRQLHSCEPLIVQDNRFSLLLLFSQRLCRFSSLSRASSSSCCCRHLWKFSTTTPTNMLSTKKLTMRRKEMKNSNIQGLLFLIGCGHRKYRRKGNGRKGVSNQRQDKWG